MNTHPDYLAQLRGICERPDDDTTRLVLADWLEEHGEPERAEFIRLQCAKETDNRYHGFLCLPERGCKNCRREQKLLALHHDDWCKPCPRKDGFGITFRRGFVHSVTCTAADWLTHADALVWHPEQTTRPFPATAQPIREVRLTTRPERLSDFELWVSQDDVGNVWRSFRWPGITFHLLGPEPEHQGLFDAAYRAGQRAAERANDAFWQAFLNPPTEPTA